MVVGCPKEIFKKTKSLFGSNILFSIMFVLEKITKSKTK